MISFRIRATGGERRSGACEPGLVVVDARRQALYDAFLAS